MLRLLPRDAANTEHASLLSICNKVLARVNEHSVDSEAFVDFPLLESTEIRGLVAVGHDRKLCVGLVDLVLIRIQHVLRDASNEVFQEAGRVLNPGLCSRSGQKDDALDDAALIVRRTVKGSLREPRH